MPAHIRKGLITGAPAFSNGGLALSIGTRVGGARRMISARAPTGVKSAGESSSTSSTELFKFVGGSIQGEGEVSEQSSVEGIFTTTQNKSNVGDFMGMSIITSLSTNALIDHMFLHEVPVIDQFVLCHTINDDYSLGNTSTDKCVTIEITGGSSSDITNKFITKTVTQNVYTINIPSDLVFSPANDTNPNAVVEQDTTTTWDGKNEITTNGIKFKFDKTYKEYDMNDATNGLPLPVSNEIGPESSETASLIESIKGKSYTLTMVRNNVFKISSPLASSNNNALEFSHNAGF